MILVFALLRYTLGVTLPNGEHVQTYIDSIIEQFEQNSQSLRHFPIIYPPLPSSNSPKEKYFLPKLLLWSPQEQYNIPLRCPVHGNELRPYQWTRNVSGKEGESARLVFDFMGNVILVQRIYLCVQGRFSHKLRSTTPDLHGTLPKYIQTFFPVEIFQRCSFTKPLIQLIETEILRGVNFFQISESLASFNYREYTQRYEVYSSALTKNASANGNTSLGNSSEFYNNPLYSFPSSDQIIRLFLSTFDKNRALYSNDMKKIPFTTLSCDHTFKVSRNVGLFRATDNKFVKEFKQLFITLNGNGEVLTWRLTKSTAFTEIKDLLEELVNRNLDAGKKVELVCVDDCCHVRKQYEKVLPRGVKVKLDLFHGCQRVTRTFSRSNSLYNDAIKNFIQIFRENDDLGESRTKSTPCKEQIEKNLNSFLERWLNIPNSPFTSATYTELENLREHIRKDCLSGIPPGCGTERNEQLHRLLNRSMITGATTISVELTVALLTLLFYQHNKKISASRHICNSKVKPVTPVSKCFLDESQETHKEHEPFKTKEHSSEKEPSLSSNESPTSPNDGYSDSPLIIVTENVEDIFQETIAANIVTEMYNLCELVENINKKNCDRSFNAVDVIHLNKMSNILTLEENYEQNDPTINSHTETLNRHLAGFNLQVETVQPDGDCAFRSIIKQIRKRACDDPEISTQLKSLGLLINEDTDTFTLRQLFVEEILEGRCDTLNFLPGPREEIEKKANEFRLKGVFDRDIGDIVIKVCSNVIKVPIIVITSSMTVPMVPFTPDESVSNQPIYIAYHYYGAGHYDATEIITSDPQSEGGKDRGCYCGRKAKTREQTFCNPKLETSRCPCVSNNRFCQPKKCRCLNCRNNIGKQQHLQKQLSCRCGETKKNKQKGSRSSVCTDVTGQRRTKCPCYGSGNPCGNLCSCHGCENSYGKKKQLAKSATSKRKRKMLSSPPSLKRKRTSQFLEEKEVEVNHGQWTIRETCLLETIESFLFTTCILPNYQNITKLYNFVVKSHSAAKVELNAHEKTEKQVLGKLNYKRTRQSGLQNLLYGLTNCDAQDTCLP